MARGAPVMLLEVSAGNLALTRFLNAVCTNTVWLKPNAMGKAGSQLCYYGGNYDAFMQVTSEEARVQESVTHKEQEE